MHISGGKLNLKSAGFTIVELLVVIVVIGILAAITIVSYTGISQKAVVASLQSDLTNAANQLKIDQVLNSNYPSALADANNGRGIPSSSGATYQYRVDNTTSPQTFCVAATKNGLTYKITNDSAPVAGTCPTLNATGGTITDIPGYRVHTFTTSGTFTLSGTSGNVELLIVAGGGGGGGGTGGGGGGGGVIYNASYAVTAGSYAVTVGAGGQKGIGRTQMPTNGSNSSVFGLTAIGGGYGAADPGAPWSYPATTGGSGGGGARWSATQASGNGTSGQGNNGGVSSGSYQAAAGGGGAGQSAPAVAGPGYTGSNGGIGAQYSISGTATYYAGGGGGSNNGVGGLGGGGNGDALTPVDGAANTGGGGGGGWLHAGGIGGSGGSGIVIIRY